MFPTILFSSISGFYNYKLLDFQRRKLYKNHYYRSWSHFVNPRNRHTRL